MNQEITALFEGLVNSELIGITISNSSDKEKIKKVKIRPVLIKNELNYQISEYIADKVYHSNVDKKGLMDALPKWFEGLFHQAELLTDKGKATVLISKKGKVTILKKLSSKPDSRQDMQEGTKAAADLTARFSHNRSKNHILQEGVALPFLVDLGVMSEDGHIVRAKSDKYRQINRFLEYIEDVLPYLDKNRSCEYFDFSAENHTTFPLILFKEIEA